MTESNIKVRVLEPKNIKYFEIVERKGIGHPDTLADGIAEYVSIGYSLHCLKKFGYIPHHNFDKVYIGGGKASISFGGGSILKPVNLKINGRVSKKFRNEKIGYEDVITQSAKEYVKKVLPHMNVEEHLHIEVNSTDHSANPYWYNPRGPQDLPEISSPKANDTSITIGFWPLSDLEKTALVSESYFYNSDSRPKYDFVGHDIKVMCIGSGENVEILVSVPFISTKTPDSKFYEEKIADFETRLKNIAEKVIPHKNVDLNMKTGGAARKEYLLLTGSCIELGEEGLVGRGNKTRGVISSTRPYSMEAPYGKNPVYHVGKIYAVIADEISKEISQKFDCKCTTFILNRVGDNLREPRKIFIDTDTKIKLNETQKVVSNILNQNWTENILKEQLLVPKIGLEDLPRTLYDD